MMLGGLRDQETIIFDMAPATRRDFLPVEWCAAAIVRAARAGLSGTYNMGSGFPVACGEVARWLITGYGRGQLAVTRDEIRDEFFLDMAKWQAENLLPPVSYNDLQTICVELGRRLRNA